MPMMTSVYWNSSLYVTISKPPFPKIRGQKPPPVEGANRPPLLAALKDDPFLRSRISRSSAKCNIVSSCQESHPCTPGGLDDAILDLARKGVASLSSRYPVWSFACLMDLFSVREVTIA